MPVATEPSERVSAAVAASPGITAAALARALGGRRTTALAVIREAITAGVVHEAPSQVQARGGSQRSTTGLYLGAAPSPEAATVPGGPGEYLRPLREQLRLPAAMLAAQLGVSTNLVYHWESGRQPVPAWVVPRLDRALELANQEHQGGAVSKKRRAEEARRAMLRAISDNPGLSRVELGRALDLSRTTVRNRLEPLLEASRAHEGRPLHRAAGRSVGLYPGPAMAAPTVELVQDVATAARRAGWSGHRIARALGIPPTTWWPAVAGTRPLPRYITEAELREVLAQAQQEGEQLEVRLVDHIAGHDDVTRESLTRSTFGRSEAVLDALDRLLTQDRVHYGSAEVVNDSGVRRFLRVLRPGPAPAAVVTLTGDELETMRRTRHVSRVALGRAVGVSDTQVGHWESGAQPIPAGRAAQLVAYLEELPIHDEPMRDPERFTDAQLADLALAYIAEHPGVTARVLAREALRGSAQRRLAVVAQLVASGRADARPVQVARSLGDTRPGTGLFLP